MSSFALVEEWAGRVEKCILDPLQAARADGLHVVMVNLVVSPHGFQVVELQWTKLTLAQIRYAH